MNKRMTIFKSGTLQSKTERKDFSSKVFVLGLAQQITVCALVGSGAL